MNKKLILILSGSVLGVLLIIGITFLIISLTYTAPTPEPTPTLPPDDITINDNGTNDSETPVTLTKPTIEIIESEVSYDKFDYEIKMTDIDNCGKILSYKIYKENDKETILFELDNISNQIEFKNSIENLMANTNYVIEVFYQYDIADGNNLTKEVSSKTITTIKYNKPLINFKTDLKYNEAIVMFDLTDESKTFNVEKYYVTFNDQEIETEIILENDYYTIKGLIGNNTYKFYINYSYNLNDGAGQILETTKLEFTTPLKDYKPIESTETPETTIEPSKITLPSKGFYKMNVEPELLQEDIFINETFNTKGIVFVIYYDSNDASTKNLLKMSASYAIKNHKKSDPVVCYYVDVNEIAKSDILKDLDNEKKTKLLNKLKNNSKLYIDGELYISGLKITATTNYEEYVLHLNEYISQE